MNQNDAFSAESDFKENAYQLRLRTVELLSHFSKKVIPLETCIARSLFRDVVLFTSYVPLELDQSHRVFDPNCLEDIQQRTVMPLSKGVSEKFRKNPFSFAISDVKDKFWHTEIKKHDCLGVWLLKPKKVKLYIEALDAETDNSIWIVCVVITVYILPNSRALVIGEGVYDPDKYPVTEIEHLKKHYPGHNILNEFCYGGYMIYQAEGSLKPFIDSRIDSLYPNAIKRDYFVILSEFREDWQETLEQYNVNLAIFPNAPTQSIQSKAFSEAGWQELFVGPVATIYKKGNTKSVPLNAKNK